MLSTLGVHPFTDLLDDVPGASFEFFDGKNGYFGDHTIEMDHIIRCFQKYIGSFYY